MALLIPTRRPDRRVLIKEQPVALPIERVSRKIEEAPDRGGRPQEAPDAGYSRTRHEQEAFTRGRSYS